MGAWVMFDPAEYDRTAEFCISEIIPLGPVDLTKEIKVGDFLLAVDGAPIGKQSNLDELLENKWAMANRVIGGRRWKTYGCCGDD